MHKACTMIKLQMWKLANFRLRLCTRKRARIFILFLFAVIQVAFMISWYYHASIALIHDMRNTTSGDTVPDRKVRNLYEYKLTPEEFLNRLKMALGNQLIIQYYEGKENDIAFEYVDLPSTQKFDLSKFNSNSQAAQKLAGYVRVYGRFWEQMSMNTRSLIALVGLAKTGGRKVLEPRVKDSGFALGGHSLGMYFDQEYFNNILASSDYNPLANLDEYNRECSLANVSHVNINFLYSAGGFDFAKSRLKMTKKEYDDVKKRASKLGWIECPALGNYITDNSNAKQMCVEPSKFTEWKNLEKDVIKGAKCVTISFWRGVGGGARTFFNENNFKIKSGEILVALKPSLDVIKEAKRFQDNVIQGPYIAVHVRGERIIMTDNLARLRRCVRMLPEAVNMLKELTNIKHVFLASDMSQFGSSGYRDVLSKQDYNSDLLKNYHSFITSGIGAIEYKPTASKVDRGFVALVEMAIIARAQHLVTLGAGSFQEWVKGRFLEQHRDVARKLWTLITVCMK